MKLHQVRFTIKGQPPRTWFCMASSAFDATLTTMQHHGIDSFRQLERIIATTVNLPAALKKQAH